MHHQKWPTQVPNITSLLMSMDFLKVKCLLHSQNILRLNIHLQIGPILAYSMCWASTWVPCSCQVTETQYFIQFKCLYVTYCCLQGHKCLSFFVLFFVFSLGTPKMPGWRVYCQWWLFQIHQIVHCLGVKQNILVDLNTLLISPFFHLYFKKLMVWILEVCALKLEPFQWILFYKCYPCKCQSFCQSFF